MAFQEFLIGKRERISIVAETSHGSGGNMAANGWIPGYNCTLEPDFNLDWQEVLSAGLDVRYVEDRHPGKKNLPYTLRFVPYNWRFLKFLMTNSDGGGAGPTYTHTFTVANSIASFRLEWAKRHTTPVVITLIGNVVRRMRVVFQKATGPGREGLIEIAAECVAKDYSIGSTVSTLAGGNPSAAPLRYKDVKLTIGGSEIVEVNSGEFTIDNGIDPEDCTYCNDTLDDTIGEPIPKVFRVGLTANINIKDSTHIDNWDSADDIASTNKLEFIKTAATDLIVFTFAKFQYDVGVAPTNLEGVTAVPLAAWINTFTTVVETNATGTY